MTQDVNKMRKLTIQKYWNASDLYTEFTVYKHEYIHWFSCSGQAETYRKVCMCQCVCVSQCVSQCVCVDEVHV